MQYIYYQFNAGPKDVIEVTLDKQANVRLMDYSNYQQYRNGQRYTYYGGLAVKTPARLVAPWQGQWYVVVDLIGFTGSVNASAKIIKG